MSEPIPDAFLCPITQEVMKVPVMAADGHSYDRHAIQTWFSQGKTTSPLTNEDLGCLELYPNHALRSRIHDFVTAQKQAKRELLLAELAVVQENQRHGYEDPLFQASLVSVDDAILDTLSVLAAVLVGWKNDLDVAKETLHAMGRVLDHNTTTNPLIVSRSTHLRLFPVIMDTLREFESDGPLQEAGISALGDVIRHRSFTGGHVDVTQASDIILTTLRRFPSDTAIHLAALECLHEIARYSPSCINKTGICRTLNQTLRAFDDDRHIQELCILIAGKVCGTNIANKLCTSGVCKRIVDCMLRVEFKHDAKILYAGCFALSRIYHGRNSCDETACHVVVHALSCAISSNEQVQGELMEAACRAVARLILIDRHQKILIELDIISSLTNILAYSTTSTEHVDISKAAIHALEMITVAEDKNVTDPDQLFPHLLKILVVREYDRDL